MKPVMASLKAFYGDRVQYHYHEFNQPETAKVNSDFEIKAHPEIFLLDRKGHLVQRFPGVTTRYELEKAITGLLR